METYISVAELATWSLALTLLFSPRSVNYRFPPFKHHAPPHAPRPHPHPHPSPTVQRIHAYTAVEGSRECCEEDMDRNYLKTCYRWYGVQ